MAQSARLHLSSVRCGQSVIAIHLSFTFGGTFYCYSTATIASGPRFTALPILAIVVQADRVGGEQRLQMLRFHGGQGGL